MEKDFMMWILCTNIISCGTNVQYIIFISYSYSPIISFFRIFGSQKNDVVSKMLIENMISR